MPRIIAARHFMARRQASASPLARICRIGILIYFSNEILNDFLQLFGKAQKLLIKNCVAVFPALYLLFKLSNADFLLFLHLSHGSNLP